MKERFRGVAFKPKSVELIRECNDIIAKYQARNLRMTLRQLYYQLVARNLIKNAERSYKNLSALISDARLAGLVDWDAIEDRVRVPKRSAEFDSPEDVMRAALASYRLRRWDPQPNYVELWVEKDAIANVLSPSRCRWRSTCRSSTSRRAYASELLEWRGDVFATPADHEGRLLDVLRAAEAVILFFAWLGALSQDARP
jgi:hypothetical protein